MTSVQSASVASSGSLTRNERLDRLPFNKAHRKLLVASGIGWAFDAMDVGCIYPAYRLPFPFSWEQRTVFTLQETLI